jgi:hypothetical protein
MRVAYKNLQVNNLDIGDIFQINYAYSFHDLVFLEDISSQNNKSSTIHACKVTFFNKF